jgi:hypothetical protein
MARHGVGYRTTVISYLRRVRTHLPQPEVFDYLADFRNVDEWDPRAHDVQRVAGKGEGSRHRCEVSFAGRTVPMTYTTTTVARPWRVEWVGTSELVRASDVVHVLPDDDGGTRVDYVASFEFAKAPWLLERVLDPPLRRLLDDAERGLGELLPATAAVSRPPSPPAR